MAGLDPDDWSDLRRLGHRMVDDMIDHLRDRRETKLWRPMPAEIRSALRDAPLPREGRDPGALYDEFRTLVVPYANGNTHPGFMGWVHGGGTAIGMLAELLAAGLNSNLGGRDHAAIEIERRVIAWSAEMLGMPPESSGLLVTGSSAANMIAVLVASRAAVGTGVRTAGVAAGDGARLVAYAATTVHGCVARAMDITGFGTDALRRIGVDRDQRIDLDALQAAIGADRAAGAIPFLVVGSAGTVDCGAIDPLDALATIAARERLWFHVDGAFGALAAVSPTRGHLLAGIGRADSLAFDFHKWAQVPYDCGCVLVADPSLQAATFAQTLDYLRRAERGLAANAPWPCDLGPDLSRGFRALKVWMTLGTFGTDRLGEVVDACCDVASHLAARVRDTPRLELAAPVALNIVCFRPSDPAIDIDRLVADLHEEGLVAPSTTTIGGRRTIRAAIVNHRTERRDADLLIEGVLARL